MHEGLRLRAHWRLLAQPEAESLYSNLSLCVVWWCSLWRMVPVAHSVVTSIHSVYLCRCVRTCWVAFNMNWSLTGSPTVAYA
jgi:hypothetical protein